MELMRPMTAAAVARYISRQLGSVKKCWCSPAVGLHATNSSTPPVVPQLFTSESSTCAQDKEEVCLWQAHALMLNKEREVRARYSTRGDSQKSGRAFAALYHQKPKTNRTSAAPRSLGSLGCVKTTPSSANMRESCKR